MDLVQATGIPETLTLGDIAYQVRLLTMREWAVVQSYLKSQLPSPVTRAYIAIQQAKNEGTPIDQATEDRMLDRAEQKALAWPPKLGSEAWFDALSAATGGDAKLLYEILSKCQLDFTLDKAEQLSPKLSSDDWANLIRVSLWGTHPRPKDEPAPTPEA
jgi:hypothetical protein